MLAAPVRSPAAVTPVVEAAGRCGNNWSWWDPAVTCDVCTPAVEAKTVARLTHAAICPIYELGKVGESLYMAVEYVQGKDLGQILRRLTKRDASGVTVNLKPPRKS